MDNEQFREARHQLGLSQAKMADALGVTVLTVCRIEGGSKITKPMALAVQHLLATLPATGDRDD